MPLTLPQTTLARAAETIAAVASDSAKEAYLSYADGKFTIRATDLANWLSVSVAVEGEMEPIQVSAAKLQEVVKGMRGDSIKLSVKDDTLTLTAKGGKRILRAIPSPYPEPQPVTGPAFIMEANRLKECIAFCEPGISDDPSKASLMGVHIHRHGKGYRAAAYNGYVLTSIEIQDGNEAIATTVTARGISLLKRIPEGAQVEMTQGERQVAFRWDGGELIAGQIDAPFIDYMEKIPTHEGALAVRGPELLSAIRAVSGIGAEEIVSRSKRILLRLGERVSLHTQSQEGQADELADAEWKGQGFDIHFASKRMEGALSGFGDDELSIGITPVPEAFDSKGIPMTIRSVRREDRVALVAPMRS